MNYIYDIVLNFNKEYYEFYEWKKTDKIINVKKIPAFKVNSDDLRDLKYNAIIVDKTFLDKIYNLTQFYSKSEYKYICLVSDTNETIGLMFDKEGKLIKRSSLVLDEENEVNEEIEKEEELKINYKENVYKQIEYISRVEKEKKEYLLKFINNLTIEKDDHILKYIYYDYFEEEEENLLKIKKILIKEINDQNSDKTKIYNLINVLRKIKN